MSAATIGYGIATATFYEFRPLEASAFATDDASSAHGDGAR
ncbi:hypothetical protein [Halobiforma nitratireducens]|nr:hypothetical protein [Halobiforma nitratireducens]